LSLNKKAKLNGKRGGSLLHKGKFLLPGIFILISEIALPQSINFGVTGGVLKLQNPDLFTKSIANEGLGFKWWTRLGIQAGYTFKKLPLTLSGMLNFSNVTGKGTTQIEGPPWS